MRWHLEEFSKLPPHQPAVSAQCKIYGLYISASKIFVANARLADKHKHKYAACTTIVCLAPMRGIEEMRILYNMCIYAEVYVCVYVLLFVAQIFNANKSHGNCTNCNVTPIVQLFNANILLILANTHTHPCIHTHTHTYKLSKA